MDRSKDVIHYPGTSQAAVAYTGTAGNSAAIGSQTHKVRVVVTSDAFVAIGSGATATTSSMFVPANRPEYFLCRPGERVSAVQVSAGGNLYVTELTN